MALLSLPNDNATAPQLIKGIRRLDDGRFVMLNEYGKLIDIDERKEATPEATRVVSRAYALAIQDVVKAGRRWTQPDWVAIREAALATLVGPRQPKDGKPGTGA